MIGILQTLRQPLRQPSCEDRNLADKIWEFATVMDTGIAVSTDSRGSARMEEGKETARALVAIMLGHTSTPWEGSNWILNAMAQLS